MQVHMGVAKLEQCPNVLMIGDLVNIHRCLVYISLW